MKREIIRCARCGENHSDIDVELLAGGEPPWTHYAMCPKTDQPVIVTLFDVPVREPTEVSYTRSELAAVIDQVHELLHQIAGDVTEQRQAVFIDRDEKRMERIEETLAKAHEFLHLVGAGAERTGSATRDPEAQELAAELMKKLEGTGLPCGHRLADLIGGKGAMTRCGACLLGRRNAASDSCDSLIQNTDPAEANRLAELMRRAVIQMPYTRANITSALGLLFLGVLVPGQMQDQVEALVEFLRRSARKEAGAVLPS